MSNNQFRGKVYHSWTQPYRVSLNPAYQPDITKEEIKTRQEMKRWEYVDNIVDNMEEYPEAERILRKILNDN